MNKIFRGTLEVKTEVLDQNAISDSSDPLREVARHVSTPSLAWTLNNNNLSPSTLRTSETARSQRAPRQLHSRKRDRLNSRRTPRVSISYCDADSLCHNLSDWTCRLERLRSGVLPNEQPGVMRAEGDADDGPSLGILEEKRKRNSKVREVTRKARPQPKRDFGVQFLTPPSFTPLISSGNWRKRWILIQTRWWCSVTETSSHWWSTNFERWRVSSRGINIHWLLSVAESAARSRNASCWLVDVMCASAVGSSKNCNNTTVRSHWYTHWFLQLVHSGVFFTAGENRAILRRWCIH